MSVAAGRMRSYFDARPWALDLALCGFATLVAGLLRLIRLGEIPYGVHPDEAGIALAAVRVTHEGWIGVYSHTALGIPTLNCYIMAPGIALLGRTAFAMRIDMALFGLAAVPLLYALVRVAYARTEAFFAAMLLAVSYWHLFYSRIAHMSITYPTLLLGALLCIMLGMRRQGWTSAALFAGGGALLGLCVYAYNIGAIAVTAVAAFLVVLTLVRYRERAAFRRWWPLVAICGGTALLVALPFLWYIADPNAYFWEHIHVYRSVGVTQTVEYQHASTIEKARIIGDQLRDFAGTYIWHGKTDYIDGAGLRPVFDPATLALIVLGFVFAFRRRGEPLVIASICCVLIVPLPALLQTESLVREPLGAAPFLMFFAALPLAAIWRAGTRAGPSWGARLLCASALAPVVVVGVVTVHDYFWTWRYDATTRYVYHQQITSASLYMRTLPKDAYVVFYSDRHPLDLETRRFLSPDTVGEDRSSQFGRWANQIGATDLPRWDGPVVFIVLGEYLPLMTEIEGRYPGGVERKASHDGSIDFIAYEVEGSSFAVGR